MTIWWAGALIAVAMFCMYQSAAAVRKPSAILWLLPAVFLLFLVGHSFTPIL